jgi:hypothetical protein
MKTLRFKLKAIIAIVIVQFLLTGYQELRNYDLKRDLDEAHAVIHRQDSVNTMMWENMYDILESVN